MAKPRQILNRRATVMNIGKITRTMEMISTGRFRKFQNRVADVRSYTEGVARMVHHTVQDAKLDVDQPLLANRDDVKRDALVVMASNRGLCGGYNAHILTQALARCAELTGEGQDVDVYAVGTKARRSLRFHGIEPVWEIAQFEHKVELDVVDGLADTLTKRFCEGELRSVQIVHATFVSASVQETRLLTLLPLGELARRPSGSAIAARRPLGPGEYDYMPTPDAILAELLPRSVSLRLYQTFLDSILSEQVARMTAMHLASENGREMARELTMEYNRARQTTITTELAEIVTGVEAMK